MWPFITNVQKPVKSVKSETGIAKPSRLPGSAQVLKHGPAMRVVFFYPGDEGTYIDNAVVTVFDNGVVHIRGRNEETTTHLQNCEILWNFKNEKEERSSKIKLLRPKQQVPEPPRL